MCILVFGSWRSGKKRFKYHEKHVYFFMWKYMIEILTNASFLFGLHIILNVLCDNCIEYSTFLFPYLNPKLLNMSIYSLCLNLVPTLHIFCLFVSNYVLVPCYHCLIRKYLKGDGAILQEIIWWLCKYKSKL
jgi:hypothetical protein